MDLLGGKTMSFHLENNSMQKPWNWFALLFSVSMVLLPLIILKLWTNEAMNQNCVTGFNIW